MAHVLIATSDMPRSNHDIHISRATCRPRASSLGHAWRLSHASSHCVCMVRMMVTFKKFRQIVHVVALSWSASHVNMLCGASVASGRHHSLRFTMSMRAHALAPCLVMSYCVRCGHFSHGGCAGHSSCVSLLDCVARIILLNCIACFDHANWIAHVRLVRCRWSI